LFRWFICVGTARAIENQCYVLAAAQYGRHNAKRESYGHSLAVDPWGTVMADAGGCDGPGTTEARETPSIITCDIDLTELASIRERMPIQQHRDAASFSF
jgi:predicted amidohydrolase